MGTYRTKQEAFRLMIWSLKTLFQKPKAEISLNELKKELEKAWFELVKSGDIEIRSNK